MLLFAKRYTLSLAVLLIALCVYVLLVVPAIEPPLREATSLPNFSSAVSGERWWQPLFAADAWEANDAQVIQNQSGVVLLSKNWTQDGPKTLSLKPLTMIFPQTESSSQPSSMGNHGADHDVIVIRAEGGAVIHFEEAFDLSTGNIPTIERGELDGQIQITRDVRGRPGQQPWSLKTSKLFLDRSRVFTQQNVLFECPGTIIHGHDAKLTLQGDLLGARDTSSSVWGPLRTLELFHLDHLQVALEPGGLWANVNTPVLPDPMNSSTASPIDFSTLPAHLQVACGGRFTFDFTKSRAILTDGVQLLHQLGQLPPDEFLSQQLVIELEFPGENSQIENSSQPQLGAAMVKQIEATGMDSLENFVGERKVEFRAPTIGAFASAKRLRVDVQENRIELDGKLSHPGATQSTAWLKYQGYEFTAPRIDYDADGNTATAITHSFEPAHLGYLVAQGAGEMRTPPQSSAGSTLVRWQDSLEMRPTEIVGQQWIGLFGNVLVESALHGYTTSDQLEIWLQKTESPNMAPARPGDSLASSQYQPQRLHATGKVNINTEQIKAEVAELSVTVNYVAAQPDPNSSSQTGPALSDSAGRPMYQWLQPPMAAAAPAETNVALGSSESSGIANARNIGIGALASAGSAALGPPKPANAMVVKGSSLSTILIVAGQQSWVDSLIVSGPLDVIGTSPSGPHSNWHVVGDQLQMATNLAGQVDMQITGQPARIALAEGSLIGPIIRFDQVNNLIWMDQPGEFTVPLSALAQPNTTGTSSVDWFEPPHCKWQGRMLFDGKVVRIEGAIEFDGAVAIDRNQFWWINGQSEVLELEMSKAVDLDELAASQLASEQSQPLRVTVSKNVNILAAQLDAGGNKKSRQQIQLPSLAFEIQTHEIIGVGPGSIRSWHLAKPVLGHTASSGARSAENLQGAQLVFRDSMRGFMNRSELYFQGKVELATGPLPSWDEAIDLAEMKQLKIDQLYLDCDLLKVYDTSSLSSTGGPSRGSLASGAPTLGNKAWEFQAKGNVNFAGRAESGFYEGSGSEVTYVQAKEDLTLWGEPKRPGKIIITPTDSSQTRRIDISVEHAIINPRIPAIKNYKPGQDGVKVEMGNSDPVGTGSRSQPTGSIPNPRSSVSDFFQPK